MAATFPTGSRVILHGLKTRPEYNGLAGVVLQPLDPLTCRCLVKLSDGEECSLRLENLKEGNPDQVLVSAASHYQIGSRVMLHGLMAQPHYNTRVGTVIKAAQGDTGRYHVRLCNDGEEVTIRSQNLKDCSDTLWPAVATSSDAALEVMLKAVSFVSKFKSSEQNDLISKMKVKDKFEFMRESSSRNAYFLECLKNASVSRESKEQVLATVDPCSHSSPCRALDDSGEHSLCAPTFSFRWSKGNAHCVENEEFDPTDMDERIDSTKDAAYLENSLFGADPPKIFPVDVSSDLGRWELCTRGVARRLMQNMGYDFKNPYGLGLKHNGPINPVAANHRLKVGQSASKNPGLGLEHASSQQPPSDPKAASLAGVNRALDNVAAHSYKNEPIRVIGKKTTRESNEQILVVAEMLKQKQAALSKLGRDAMYHPEQIKHLVAGKIQHVQSEVEDLKRAAEEALRIAQLRSASKKLKKGKDIF